MSKKLSLNDQLYEIISGHSDSTAAGMIRDHIADMFDELLEEYRSSEEVVWTDEHEEIWNNWTKGNI